MGCCQSRSAPSDSPEKLAAETHFSVDEVYALEELFHKLSNSLHHDGRIHKDEFALALFKAQQRSNLFTDRVFEVFDTKKNDVIDFGEFVRALSVFHPKAPLEEKAAFAFRIYDLDNTGSINQGEVQRLLAALLADNPALDLDEGAIHNIVQQTFAQADTAGDGIISPQEWLDLVSGNPSIIDYMTLPVLKEVTKQYASFVFNKERRYDA
ncbi:hypothetical protein WJX81_003861 [Elliptochloris bilobata]|uniref:EF-hand domain-containing protein n=1 Tax=Elliptochloris bilobata TaxID=381761 RepID=A0AAW1RXI7_9CHLO